MLNMNKKFMMIVVAALMALMVTAQVQAATLYQEDFSTLPTVSLAKTGFTWAGLALDTTYYVSEPSSMKISGSGGSGVSYVYATMPLGAAYDLYAGGLGQVSVQVSRFSTSRSLTMELLDL